MKSRPSAQSANPPTGTSQEKMGKQRMPRKSKSDQFAIYYCIKCYKRLMKVPEKFYKTFDTNLLVHKKCEAVAA